MLYPLWHAASLTDMQLITKVGDSKFGSSMSTSLRKTGQFLPIYYEFRTAAWLKIDRFLLEIVRQVSP